jgi:AraC-like DNA-binding protein
MFKTDMPDEDKNRCALAKQRIGKIYYDRGNYVNALEAFVEGMKICGQCDRQLYAARIYNNIGNVYCIFLDYEKGVDYYLKAYDFCRKYLDRETEHDILVNLTGMYTFLKDFKNARKYYRLAENTKNAKDPEDIYMSGYTLSLIQMYEGNVPPAVARLKRLATYAKEKGIEPRCQCFAYQELFNAYNLTGPSDSALKYMKLCDATARKYELQHSFATTLKSLSRFYKEKGDANKANIYMTRYFEIMDSIYNMREFDAAKNALFTYEVGQTAREISDLRHYGELKERTIVQQRILIGAVCFVAFVTVVFLVVVWRQKRRIDRSYADLYKVKRDFVDTQGQLVARLRKESEALKECRAELAGLKSQAERDKGTEAQLSSEPVKYRTSSLTDEQSRALAAKIQDVMENTVEFCDCDFSLNTLAEIVGTNRNYVSQVINDVFHKSFSDYVNPYRIHLACTRFADKENYGHFTMKAIGESVGFKSYTSFVNIFRKVTGITPSMYCKMAANNSVDV